MEEIREAVDFCMAGLSELQEVLQDKTSDASSNSSGAQYHLARFKVWAASIQLASPVRFEV